MNAAQRIRSAWPLIVVISGSWPRSSPSATSTPRLRLPVVVWFLLVCPGTALVRLLDLEDLLAEVTVGIGLSAALAIIVSGVMLYAHAWSPHATLAVLLGITMFAALLDMRRRRSSVHQEGESA